MSRASVDFHGLTQKLGSGRKLDITVSAKPEAPSRGHELLVAFHFGAAEAVPLPAAVSPGLIPIDGGELYECWWYDGPVEYRSTAGIRIAESDDYALHVLQRDDVPPDRIRRLTADSYTELLGAIASSGHRRIAKIWNTFPQINEGNGDHEKYRQFSIGRAEAFERAGLLGSSIPCGTAVGAAPGSQLSIVALTTKHDFVAVENPRQISAYVYPRQYGPRSPMFSRGGSVDKDGHRLEVLSGTAAIVGHESAHPYRTLPQLGETLENLAHLGRALSAGSRKSARLLDEDSVLRVYLRDANDLEQVVRELEHSPCRARTTFLRADICRRELMIEIDGVRFG